MRPVPYPEMDLQDRGPAQPWVARSVDMFAGAPPGPHQFVPRKAGAACAKWPAEKRQMDPSVLVSFDLCELDCLAERN